MTVILSKMNIVVDIVVVLYFSIEVVLGQAPNANAIEIANYLSKHSKVKKVVKKLRIRNYPSLALFHNGSKKKVWKADMDGVVDVTNKHIKKSIQDALAGDVF